MLEGILSKKFEMWGFAKTPKDNNITHLDITVKNIASADALFLAFLSGFICGLSLYLIPSVATDKFQMNVTITLKNKEVVKKEYAGSITSYQQIGFIVWGIIVYPPADAVNEVLGNMADNLFHDLAELK